MMPRGCSEAMAALRSDRCVCRKWRLARISAPPIWTRSEGMDMEGAVGASVPHAAVKTAARTSHRIQLRDTSRSSQLGDGVCSGARASACCRHVKTTSHLRPAWSPAPTNCRDVWWTVSGTVH
eukprot:2867921-Prymnesium_polylepis.1